LAKRSDAQRMQLLQSKRLLAWVRRLLSPLWDRKVPLWPQKTLLWLTSRCHQSELLMLR
uniref:IS110 family transposase n=1 Tax=Anisakis simplex TaxID=6269 RepID=A0A0M3JPP4_ANISI